MPGYDELAQDLAPTAPEVTGDSYDAVARSMKAEADQASQAQGKSAAYRATSSGLEPARAARVLQLSADRGVAPDEAQANYDNLRASTDEDLLASALAGQPAVSEYMAQSPAHAALVKKDVPILKMIGESLELGFVDVGAALEANKQAKVGLTPEEEEHLAFVEQVQAAGPSGASTLPRKVVAEVARATPTVAVAGSATAAGAAIGSLGGPIGAGIGALVGAFGSGYVLNFGPLYRRLKALVSSDDGETPLLTDEQAKAWASGGAAVSAAVQAVPMTKFLQAVPGAGAALQKVGLDAATRAAQSTIGKAAIARLTDYGGHVLAGGLAMAGQSAVNAATVELAKQQNGVEPGWGAVTDAATEGFKSGLLLAPLALYEPGRAFLGDVGRIRNARLDAARLEVLAKVSQHLEALAHAPEEAEKLLGSMAQRGDTRTVFVDLEHVPEEVKATIAAAVGPEAIAEAAATKGDVAVPIETYLTRIAPEHHDALRQDVKLSPDGMTLRQAVDAQEQPLARAMADVEIAKTMPEGPERRAAIDAAHNRMRDALWREYGGTPEAWDAKLKEDVGGKPLADVLAPKPPPSPSPPADAALRDYAKRVTEGKRLGDLAPGRRDLAARNAERKALELGEKSTVANAEGNPQTPGRAQNRLHEMSEFENARDLNRALARAEKVALEEAEKNRKFLLRYTSDEARGELGKAGQDYVDQTDRLLAGFELGQGASRLEVARRQATMDWVAREQEAGRDPVIPDSVMAKLDRFVHWKETTPQELRDLRAAVESIAHQAELKNTILARQARVSRDEGKAELVASLRTNTEAKPFRPTGSIVGNLEQALDKLRGLKYGARAIERVVNQLDGDDINGPWHRLVWDPVSDGTQRWHDLVRRTTEAIVSTIDEMPRAEMKRWRETRFRVSGVDYDLSAAVAVALNWGNDSNRGKLLRGWQDKSVRLRGLTPWTEDTPEQFLSRLTRRDWGFVQTVWDRLESMWPEAAALEKRLTGLEPPKVEPRAFTRTIEDGSAVDLKGGYYPVLYDPDFSGAGKAQDEGAAQRSVKLFDPSYYRAATPQGYLQKRVENFARPVLLSIDSLPHKISETAKDVAMREALISVHSVLTDGEISAALHTSELGRAGEKALLGWLRDTANDLVVPDNGSGQWLTLQNRTRAGYTASLFAYNLAQTAQNLTAIAPATRAVGPRWMTEAMLRLAKERGSLIEWMDQQSGELRNRDRSGQPIAEALQTLSEGKALTKDFMQFGLKFFQATDTAVVYPTWLAAFMKGTTAKEAGGLGMDHATAVRHADATVRLNVMASSTKDLPAILRSKVGRWMLPLYSYSLHRLNLIGDAVGLAQNAVRQRAIGRAAGILAGTWGALAMEAVVSEVVKGNGPGDENGDGTVDAGDVAMWAAKISAVAPLTWIPILGQAARAVATGRDPLGTPEMSVMTAVGKGVRDAGKLAYQASPFSDETVDEQLVQRTAMHLLEAGGYVGGAFGGGLPVSQLRSTAGYLLDENSPKDTPLQVGLGTAFGKARPGKLLNLTE